MNEDQFALIERAMAGVAVVPCAPCVGTGETLEGICPECDGTGATTTREPEVGDDRQRR